MKFVTLLFVLMLNQAYAFTLTDNAPPRFKDSNEIKISVTSDGCVGSGISAERLLELSMLAVEEYWNSVETANIEFVEGGIANVTGQGQGFSTILESARTQLGENNVLVACSTNISANAAAVGGAGGNSDGAYGAVIMGDISTNFSRGEEITIAILAHEFGHVLGLGHSRFDVALMDSSGGAIGLNKLTQDDRDGATFLYPYESGADCFTSIGSINNINNSNERRERFLVSLILGLGFALSLSWFFSLVRQNISRINNLTKTMFNIV